MHDKTVAVYDNSQQEGRKTQVVGRIVMAVLALTVGLVSLCWLVLLGWIAYEIIKSFM